MNKVKTEDEISFWKLLLLLEVKVVSVLVARRLVVRCLVGEKKNRKET